MAIIKILSCILQQSIFCWIILYTLKTVYVTLRLYESTFKLIVDRLPWSNSVEDHRANKYLFRTNGLIQVLLKNIKHVLFKVHNQLGLVKPQDRVFYEII